MRVTGNTSQQKKRTSGAIRVRKFRASLRAGGRARAEVFLTLATKELMNKFGGRTKMSLRKVTDLVMEFATPLYLRELTKLLDEVAPLFTRLREFEYWGVHPSPTPTASVRIGSGPTAVNLDPHEHHKLRAQLIPLLEKLRRYGFPPEKVSAIFPKKAKRVKSVE